MASARIGAALLAAGASRRFGDADKLAQPFGERPLGEQAARALPLDLFERAWVITARRDADWSAPGFERQVNPEAKAGMGTSVALAARLAQDARLDGLLIALADMPLVRAEHFQSLVAAFSGETSIATSAIGTTRMPPALFGAAHFDALSRLDADSGARPLLARGTVVACPPEWLVDIDTPDALQTYGHAASSAPKPAHKGEN